MANVVTVENEQLKKHLPEEKQRGTDGFSKAKVDLIGNVFASAMREVRAESFAAGFSAGNNLFVSQKDKDLDELNCQNAKQDLEKIKFPWLSCKPIVQKN